VQSSLRILLVDDSDVLRTVIVRMIREWSEGWQVCGEAVDGADAIRQNRALKPDVVLLDLSLPLQNGLDVATILRKTDPSGKIVIMSEQDPSALYHLAMEFGFECIPKSRLALDLIPTLQRFSSH